MMSKHSSPEVVALIHRTEQKRLNGWYYNLFVSTHAHPTSFRKIYCLYCVVHNKTYVVLRIQQSEQTTINYLLSVWSSSASTTACERIYRWRCFISALFSPSTVLDTEFNKVYSILAWVKKWLEWDLLDWSMLLTAN